jgi:type III secretion protein I
MIEALVSSGTLAAGTSSASTPLVQANFGDVDRFRAAMMTAQDMPGAAVQEKAMSVPNQPNLQPTVQTMSSSNSGHPTLGETILSTLQDLSTDTKQRYGKVGEMLSKPEISMTELMSVQYALLQTSLQFEIASKGISKLTQNLDAVLKTS